VPWIYREFLVNVSTAVPLEMSYNGDDNVRGAIEVIHELVGGFGFVHPAKYMGKMSIYWRLEF
jgi:hypothetical protein